MKRKASDEQKILQTTYPAKDLQPEYFKNSQNSTIRDKT